MGPWAALQETDSGKARAGEGRGGREGGRVCDLHVELASLAEKGKRQEFQWDLISFDRRYELNFQFAFALGTG